MVANDGAVSAAEFAAAMAALGPFEARAAFAVAVSGGADSTALALLAAEWVRARGGTLAALTVDHGLRPESAEEARQVAARMAAAGIDGCVLGVGERVTRGRPGSQAAARELRYEALLSWCRRHGVRYLLLGHHRRDQAETVLMRLLHGSGLDGLAGMASRVERADVHLLRPLLAIPPDRLRAFLLARGQSWISDPSNASPAFERNRLRGASAALGPAGLAEGALLRLAAAAGVGRRAFATYLASWLADGCRLHPAGWARLDADVLAAAGPDLAAAMLGRVIATVGGRPWPPGAEESARLARALRTAGPGPVGSLGGCVVARTRDGILCYRELRNLPPARPLASPDEDTLTTPGGEVALWDGRFRVRWRLAPPAPWRSLQLRPLGADGWRQWRERGTAPARGGAPRAALLSLPALFAGERLLAPPGDGSGDDADDAPAARLEVTFCPRWPLPGAGTFLFAASPRIL